MLSMCKSAKLFGLEILEVYIMGITHWSIMSSEQYFLVMLIVVIAFLCVDVIVLFVVMIVVAQSCLSERMLRID